MSTNLACAKKSNKNTKGIAERPNRANQELSEQLPSNDDNKNGSGNNTQNLDASEDNSPLPQVQMTEAVVSQCRTSWEEWRRSQGGHSPFEAVNTKWPWQIEQQDINGILTQEDFNVELDKALYIDSQAIYSLNADELASLGVQDQRDRDMQEHIVSMVEEAPADELTMILSGFMHTVDAHFMLVEKQLDSKVLYSTFKVDDYTQFETDASYDFMEALGKPKPREYAKDKSGVLAGFYAKIFHARNKYPTYTTSDAFGEATFDANSNIVLIGDLHHIVNSEYAEKMPEPHCLQALGFKSVRFSFETLNTYKIPYAENKWFSYADAKASLDEVEAMNQTDPTLVGKIREARPAAYEIMINNHFYGDNIRNILKRLKLYERYGVKVQYRGIE